MPFFRKNEWFSGNKVVFLPVDAIRPNPAQPRKNFSSEGLEELARSIAAHGILQPLTVRRTEEGYELVSGERRLRAAKLAGLTQVPCLAVSVDETESSLLALIENIQRRDLDFLEEALAIQALLDATGLSQEALAKKLGKSQSALANKLRLLRLSPEALELLRRAGLSERHARALLKLPNRAAQEDAARYIIQHDLTVARAESYIESLLHPPAKRPAPVFLLKDVRLFLNTVKRGLSMMDSSGIHADCRRQDTPEAILLTIRIPR